MNAIREILPRETAKEKGQQISEPPLEWFCGVGNTQTGITGIVNNTFTNLKDGAVGEHWLAWSHLTANLNDGKTPAGQRKIAEAEVFIKEATGSPPQVIVDKGRQLLTKFWRQKTAPFEVQLHPPKKISRAKQR